MAWLASIGARDGAVSGHCLLLPSGAGTEFRRGSLSTDDPIAAVSGLSAGAEFHRCAFQVNPHHYAGTYRGQASALDEAGYAQALVALLRYLAAIDVDHWCEDADAARLVAGAVENDHV